MYDQLFASFVLDQSKELEIALKAESVSEATSVSGKIKELPASIDYLEGIMSLREDIIPVINLKKRLGLDNHSYPDDAKVAVVSLHEQQFGLLFDDIKEVFRTDAKNIMPLNSLLQTDDRIVSAIIKMDSAERTVELLDLGHLFKGQSVDMLAPLASPPPSTSPPEQTSYSRWVVFTCFGQPYGVPVRYAREIAFFSEIDDMFKSGNIEGAIQLRGSTIPVMSGRYLLAGKRKIETDSHENRVLILATDECSFGMVVDEINEIITVADNAILSVPSGGSDNLQGIYSLTKGDDIMLLDMPNLVCNQIDDIKSLAKLNGGSEKGTVSHDQSSRSHHLITENCYLIFAIHKHFAIELKDVQEIIESENLLKIPRASGYSDAVINLRGDIVPVINVRNFYGYPQSTSTDSKLIICRGQSRIIALEVDHIVTIFKQEEYHSTPSLNPQLSQKKDTLDRLIEFEREDEVKEHVLVLNMHNLVRNHLEFKETKKPHADETESETALIKSQGEHDGN